MVTQVGHALCEAIDECMLISGESDEDSSNQEK